MTAPREARAGSRPMVVVDGIDGLDASHGRLFIVVGVFDGLHLGHQYLLRELVGEAARLVARPAVLTFDHHPDEILAGAAPPLLCDPAERLRQLALAGVGVTIVQTFDAALRETPYDAFVRLIARRVDLAGFLMTPESAFGFQRAGTPDRLAALGRELGYELVIVPPFSIAGEPVRSTDIRAAIAAGDLGRAERLLGRPVSIAGRARTVDGATVVEVDVPVALPAAGSHAAMVAIEGQSHLLRLRLEGNVARLEPPLRVPDGTALTITLRS